MRVKIACVFGDMTAQSKFHFYVETDALKRLFPKISDIESEFLQAFDNARNRIHEIANKVYMCDGKGAYSYILAAGDF